MKLETAIILCNDAEWLEEKIQFEKYTFSEGERWSHLVGILKSFCGNMKEFRNTGVVTVSERKM